MSNAQPTEELDRFLQALGPHEFNKLLQSVEATEQKGRLRHWQEKLLTRAARAGFPPLNHAEFLSAFRLAVPVKIPQPPLTKERFLAVVREYPLAGHPDTIDATWMAAAWAINSVRDAHTYEMSRSVSKVGELWYEARYLELLAEALSIDQQVELFLAIRADSPHREPEFRPGFEKAFPKCVERLPAPLPETTWDDDGRFGEAAGPFNQDEIPY